MSVPFELDGAAGRLHQPQHAARDRRFAAAGFADQPQRFALADREADAVDGMHGADAAAQDAAAHRVMLDEVGDLEQGALSVMARPPFPPRASTPQNDRRRIPAAADIRRGSGRSRSAARRKGAAGGRLVSDGTMPGISFSRASVLGAERNHRRHRGHQAARVGMLRIREQRLDGRFLDLLAGIHHDDALRGLRDDAEIVRDQDQPGAELLLQIDDQLQDLRLDRDVERGGRLVRDQQRRPARQRHRDHRALPHAAGKLMRIFLRPPLRLGDADQAQHLDRLSPTPPWPSCPGAAAAPRRSGRRSASPD